MQDLMVAATGTKDNGSCCGLKTVINPYAAKIDGAKTAAGAASATGAALEINGWSCVAFSNR